MNTRGHAARRRLSPFAAIFVLLLCAHTGAAVAQVDYLSIAPDLPLMPGLNEQAERVSNFDSPEGRIAETAAFGAVSAVAVGDFYNATLPQLGWQSYRCDVECWRRENERLEIAMAPSEGGILVIFRLKPAPN